MSASGSNHQSNPTNSEQQMPNSLSCQKNDLYNINCSAPGKIILSGEYSVVYGKVSLMTPNNI